MSPVKSRFRWPAGVAGLFLLAAMYLLSDLRDPNTFARTQVLRHRCQGTETLLSLQQTDPPPPGTLAAQVA